MCSYKDLYMNVHNSCTLKDSKARNNLKVHVHGKNKQTILSKEGCPSIEGNESVLGNAIPGIESQRDFANRKEKHVCFP